MAAWGRLPIIWKKKKKLFLIRTISKSSTQRVPAGQQIPAAQDTAGEGATLKASVLGEACAERTYGKPHGKTGGTDSPGTQGVRISRLSEATPSLTHFLPRRLGWDGDFCVPGQPSEQSSPGDQTQEEPSKRSHWGKRTENNRGMWGTTTTSLTEPDTTHSLCACIWSCFSHVRLFATPWTAACQAPLSTGILQARILEWVAMPSPRESSRPRDRTHVSFVSRTDRQVLYQ